MITSLPGRRPPPGIPLPGRRQNVERSGGLASIEARRTPHFSQASLAFHRMGSFMRQLRPAPHGALPPLSPGVPFAFVSAVYLVPQVYNQNTSKSVIVEWSTQCKLCCSFSHLGLKTGHLEQPGNNSSDGTDGAVHDQQLTQSLTGSTEIAGRCTAPKGESGQTLCTHAGSNVLGGPACGSIHSDSIGWLVTWPSAVAWLSMCVCTGRSPAPRQ